MRQNVSSKLCLTSPINAAKPPYRGTSPLSHPALLDLFLEILWTDTFIKFSRFTSTRPIVLCPSFNQWCSVLSWRCVCLSPLLNAAVPPASAPRHLAILPASGAQFPLADALSAAQVTVASLSFTAGRFIARTIQLTGKSSVEDGFLFKIDSWRSSSSRLVRGVLIRRRRFAICLSRVQAHFRYLSRGFVSLKCFSRGVWWRRNTSLTSSSITSLSVRVGCVPLGGWGSGRWGAGASCVRYFRWDS